MLPLALRSPLTKRQEQILQLLADGMRQKEIAERLGITAQTVKNHLHGCGPYPAGVCRRMGQRTLTGAVAEAMRNMWIV